MKPANNAFTILSASLVIAGASASTTSSAAEENIHWEKDVWPFIERSCVECHKAPYKEGDKMKEPKAELRFDGAWAIMKGGENGPVLMPGKPGDSEMYSRVTLPEDDSDFMPSKGEALTENEKEILKAWIAQGADFGGWEGNLEGKPEEPKEEPRREVKPLPPSVYEILSKNVPAPPEDALKALTDSGARVDPLADSVTLYRVDYFNARDNTGDANLELLAKLKNNIAQLNLGETQVTDAGIENVADLPNLVRLDLHQTKIGDPAIDHLLELKNLEYLNLYGTQVSDAGIKKLSRLTKLKAVYLWQTKATEKGIRQLQKELPGRSINWR